MRKRGCIWWLLAKSLKSKSMKSQVWLSYWNVDQSFCVNLKWHIWPAWTFEFFCLIFSPLAGLCATLFCFPSFYIIKPAPCNYGAGVCRVHLQRRKWPATPNWLDSCFIEVMDGEVCFVALGLHPPQVFDPPLENWPESHDLCHRQGLIVGLYLLQFSLFWLWIFVTMTGHRAAVLYEYCAALILCHRMIINVSSHLVSLSSTTLTCSTFGIFLRFACHSKPELNFQSWWPYSCKASVC